MISGLDTNSPASLDIEAAWNAGFRYIFVYVAPQTYGWWKAVTLPTLNALRARGFTVVPMWEGTASEALGGVSQGARDGQTAAQAFRDLDNWQPPYVVVTYDFDATSGQFGICEGYSEGFHQQLPIPQIPYGGTALIAALQRALPTINVGGLKSDATGWGQDQTATVWVEQGLPTSGYGVNYDPDTVLIDFANPKPPLPKEPTPEEMMQATIQDGMIYVAGIQKDSNHGLLFTRPVVPQAGAKGNGWTVDDITAEISAANPGIPLYLVQA